MLAVCGCIVLNELGHALMARYFHIATRDITLYPIGGVARLEKMTTRPSEEIWIALAGPAVNLVIAALLAIVFVPLFGSPLALEHIYDGSGQSLLQQLLLSNIFLALFNLLPAFPMDGGRVLRAIMAIFVDYVSATQIACYLGIAMAGLFILASLVSFSPILALIGVFVIFADLQELAMVRHRQPRRRAPATCILPAD